MHYPNVLFEGPDHVFNFQVLAIANTTVRGGDVKTRTESIESEWIIRLRANIPPGLNENVPIKPFLRARRLKVHKTNAP